MVIFQVEFHKLLNRIQVALQVMPILVVRIALIKFDHRSVTPFWSACCYWHNIGKNIQSSIDTTMLYSWISTLKAIALVELTLTNINQKQPNYSPGNETVYISLKILT